MSNDESNWPEHVPVAPPVSAPPPPSPEAIAAAMGDLDAPLYVSQNEVLKSRGIGGFVALAVGLLFLGGVTAVAVASFTGDREGAESPEAAVEALGVALDQEDVVAALEIMAPSEIGTASELYPRALELAVQEGALEDIDWLAGVDFAVSGLETRTEQLHDGVALVELVAGTFSVTIDPDLADAIFLEAGETRMSITVEEMQQSLAELIDDEVYAEQDFFEFPFSVVAPDGIFLMTVKRNGGWFVSPFYTGAEYGRQILDLRAADFAASRENAAAGADSAGDVIDDLTGVLNDHQLDELVQAVLDGDSAGIFEPLNAFIPPDEAGVYLDYAPSYLSLLEDFMGDGEMSLDDLRRQFTGMVEEIQLEGRVSLDIDVREEARPDGAVVLYLESGSFDIDASVIDPDSREVTTFSAEASWDGLCGRASAVVDGDRQESVSDCVPTDVLPAGFDEVFVVVGEVDGDWYMSYVETALAYAEIFLEGELEN